MGPDELVAYVQLPESLKDLDYLQEFYGRIDWSVRSVHNEYLGWFDENAISIIPLTPIEEAKRMANLAGGSDQLLQHTKDAMNKNDYQWAALQVHYHSAYAL